MGRFDLFILCLGRTGHEGQGPYPTNFNETTEVEYRPVVFNVVRATRSNLLLRIGEC